MTRHTPAHPYGHVLLSTRHLPSPFCERLPIATAAPASQVKDKPSWIRDSIFVCGGDFAYESDKQKIVDNLLALWGCMLETKDTSEEKRKLYDLVVEHRAEVFPELLDGECAAAPPRRQAHAAPPAPPRPAHDEQSQQQPPVIVCIAAARRALAPVHGRPPRTS